MIQTHSQRVQATNTAQMAAALPSESRARVQMDTVPFILGKITGYTALPAPEVNRWLYTWTQANIGNTTRYIFSVPSPEPWYLGDALNVTEAANTTTFVGPNINPRKHPGGICGATSCNRDVRATFSGPARRRVAHLALRS